jgi:UDP-N-acetylmuramoylalanine--D-glutamate ligase
MNYLRDQHVLILGLGVSGLAMARWCARCGAQVTIADTRTEPPQLATLQREVPQARFVGGAFAAELLGIFAFPPLGDGGDGGLQLGLSVTAVFKSPGLSPAEIAIISEAAYARQISVRGELALYSEALEQLKTSRAYAPKVLAITGTNGKTTVTSLTGQLVERAGKSVAVAGNIGPTLLSTLIERLDSDSLPEVWVLELSSFQLDGERNFAPSAASVLNITQDHLDWHGSMQAYAQAKSNIFGATGLMVLNREDESVMGMLPAPSKVKLQDATPALPQRREGAKPQRRDYVTFGGDMPQRPGDFGIQSVNGMTWLVRAQDSDTAGRKRKDAPEELHIQRLMPADALRIRGRHNAINALSALALASAAGCALAPMLYGLREYTGEPHRVQPIGILSGVEYFDDSKGTNVGATVAALQGLGSERKVLVILGGEGKGQDFSPLAAPVQRYVRAVLLIGRDAPLLRAALAQTGVPLLDASSMADAVQQASGQAHAGDAVLMSPACASFDMFNNYEHRAHMFVAAVQALALEQGVALEAGL